MEIAQISNSQEKKVHLFLTTCQNYIFTCRTKKLQLKKYQRKCLQFKKYEESFGPHASIGSLVFMEFTGERNVAAFYLLK